LSNTGGQISIEIISLKFREDSGIFDDSTIKQIYVEYNFLGYAGHLLETPQSIAITSTSNGRLVYNFRNTFDVESGYDSEPSFKASILLSMLMPTSKNLLKFICVNEPTEEDLVQNEDAECSEIGCEE
jgi:Retinitis pigmentosa G-protein regulator interacting C-terminal